MLKQYDRSKKVNLPVTKQVGSVCRAEVGSITCAEQGSVSRGQVGSVSAEFPISHKTDYNSIIIASSSFLENLSALTPAGRLYRLQRFEWDIWQTIIAQSDFDGIVKYGDYGTKYPFYTEANFPGSCSIKYTLPTEFIIYRGEISGNHPQGNGQYIVFADRLVRSADFSGTGFSWGDARINFYAAQVLANPNRQTGNATSWVQISQNHHITLVHSIL